MIENNLNTNDSLMGLIATFPEAFDEIEKETEPQTTQIISDLIPDLPETHARKTSKDCPTGMCSLDN